MVERPVAAGKGSGAPSSVPKAEGVKAEGKVEKIVINGEPGGLESSVSKSGTT